MPKKISGKDAPPTSAPVGSPAAAPSALSRLKPSQQAVVAAYLDQDAPTYLKQGKAYQAAHPKAKDSTSRVEGHRVLTNPNVHAVITEELTVRGLDRAGILDELAWNIRTAKATGKLSEHREGVMASAKVQGLITDKQEVKSIQDSELQAVRKVVNDVLKGGSAS